MRKHSILLFICMITSYGYSQQVSLLYTDNKIEIYNSKALFEGKEIYNAETRLLQLLKEEDTIACKFDYSFYYNPLSLIGKYYSYEAGESGSYGCGSPSNFLAIHTINLSTGATISLSDIFTEESIRKALKDDNWVKKSVKESGVILDSVSSFASALDVLSSVSDDVKFTPGGFAIYRYDKEKKIAAVRVVGVQYLGYDHYQYLQLGFWLRPTPEFNEELQHKTRFTLGKYKNGLVK